MRTSFSILLGKAIFWISNFFKLGGGSAAPGLYALKIQPNLVKKLTSKIPVNVAITGTNGKTTTARMISHFAKASGLKVIRNHTGSNLERGIASTLIKNSNLHLPGVKLNFDLGIWELDEAAFNSIIPQIQPNVIVFLNVFRDQLDRYGEVDSVVKRWCETLKNVNPKTTILINGDDYSLSRLRKAFAGKVLKFGVQDYKIIGESIEHIKEQESLDFEAKNVKLNGLTSTSFTLYTPNAMHHTILPLPGIYHIYDFLAAFGAGSLLGFDQKKMIASLKNFSPAFGRVEKFSFGYIFLIKNPAGATQVFETIAPQLKTDDRLLLALNDNLADGTDVSWIWDANFEHLTFDNGQLNLKSQISNVCSGTRAYDLANRLKYAGFDPEAITIQPDLKQAFKEAREALKGRLFILPTYTAMLELQKILVSSKIKKNYWEEE